MTLPLAKRGRSRGCVGARTRYCRGPAGAQVCASPISAICDDFRLRPSASSPHKIRFPGRACLKRFEIALDAMGGDVGASVVIPGAAISLSRHPDTEFLLFGDRASIDAQLSRYPAMKAVSRVFHTDVAVSMDDKPSQALRRGRKTSSMWLAIDAVKKGEADVAVSAGNTGALMAMARFNLRMLPGIDRPAIAAVWPTVRGEFGGARSGCHDRRRRAPFDDAGGDGQRDGERTVRSRAADRRPAQYRGRGGQRRRGNPRGRRVAARDEPAPARIYRLRRRRRHRQGRRRRHRYRGL